jgi:hypothetical protein
MMDWIQRCTQQFIPDVRVKVCLERTHSDLAIQMIPGIFLWTAFPVTIGIDMLYEECKPQIDQTSSTNWPISADRVELMSILERLKHYNESGNARTLPYSALQADRQGSYKHLLTTGWPYLGDMIRIAHPTHNGRSKMKLIMERIPWNEKTQTVALSAATSIRFHYGPTAEKVRF